MKPDNLSKKTAKKGKQQTIPGGQKIDRNKKYIYYLDTRSFKGKEGFNNYYKNYKGVWNFIFDNYKKKDELVLVQYDKKNAVEMRVTELMIHLILWRPNVSFNVAIDGTDFYVIHPLSREKINNILDRIVIKFIEILGEVTTELAYSVSYIVEDFGKIAECYSSIACNTISLYDIIEFKNRNPTFKKLLETELSDSSTVKANEDIIKAGEKLLVDTINKDKINNFYPYVVGARINKSQLTQMLVAVGPRPDIDKTVLPKVISRGYIHGLADIAEFYVESVTARDALLTKYNNVPLSGYLSRKMNILCLGTEIDYTKEDCGSKHYLTYTVKDKSYFNMIIGKNMVTDSGKIVPIKESDKHLIGQTIKLRSHVTCCLNEPGKVCKTCYGQSHKMMIGTRIGGLPSIKIANPMSGKAMSAKHHTGTNSIEITNKYIQEFFTIDGTNLFLKKDALMKAKNMSIVLDKDDIDELFYCDFDDSSINMVFPLNNIILRCDDNDFVIENEGLLLTLSDALTVDKDIFEDDESDSDKVIIPLKKIDTEVPVFSMILTTEEISKYLKIFISMTDRNAINKYNTYDELIQDLINVTSDSGIFVKLTHFETVVYNMIRSKLDVTRRPDFTQPDVEYSILKVSQAIEKKDVYTSLIFQGIKRQFKDISSHRKSAKGVYDCFFKVSPVYNYEQDIINRMNSEIEDYNNAKLLNAVKEE